MVDSKGWKMFRNTMQHAVPLPEFLESCRKFYSFYVKSNLKNVAALQNSFVQEITNLVSHAGNVYFGILISCMQEEKYFSHAW